MFRDVVIVGSGFGGAVIAARLGRHVASRWGGAKSVLLLERGDDPGGDLDPRSRGGALNAQGNRFAHSLAPSYVTRWASLTTDTEAIERGSAPTMSVIAGRGLGGGSNVYCGVSLRAPASIFDQQRERRRLWPAVYSRAALDPHYARVESMLRVHRMQWTDATVPRWQLATKRDFVFAEGCRRIGATAVPLKIADHADANEGWWTQGQRFEGRQSLAKNYLREARGAGVEIASGVEVEDIAPAGADPSAGYVVRAVDHRDGAPRELVIECRMLVIAAGAIGSTAILLRSEPAFDEARALDPGATEGAPRLGRHVSGNGDYGVTGLIGDELEEDVEGHKGKPMSSFSPSFWREHRFVLIPFYAEPIYLAMSQFSTLASPDDEAALGRRSTGPRRGEDRSALPDWGLAYKQRLARFGSRMLTMGCLALDASEGEIRLGDGGRREEVRWTRTDDETEARWSIALDTMRRIYEALGGELFLDSYRRDGTVSTAHPLGGARMSEAEEPLAGIVDPLGECHRNPGLFVIDGAIVPSAIGVNPSLTIAAVAESIAERLIAGRGTTSLDDRLSSG
jgi:choline dehydrogenase-like flavoprotein